MKRIVRYVVAIGLIAALSAPVMEGRNGRTGRGNRTEQLNGNSGSGNTPGSRSPRNHNKVPKPGNDRPSGSHNNAPKPNNNRPSGGHNNAPKPGNNRPGKRPATPQHRPVQPPVASRPGHHAPTWNRPGHGTPPPPVHSHWPAWHRPTPPRGHHFRPGHGPSFGTILGMAIGTAFNASLNYLYNNSYQVAGYGRNEIYLNNVMQMNYQWPDAVLLYNNGVLSSSRYLMSTVYNDMYRYNALYNSFVGQYGAPISYSNQGGSMTASWFGYDGRYVTISYSPGYNANGQYCYYTTLTFGN